MTIKRSRKVTVEFQSKDRYDTPLDQQKNTHLMNELLWIALILAHFSLTLLAFRCWGKLGLFIAVCLSIVLANIQVLKQIELFGLHCSMGDISYMAVYLISDILSENYGKAVAKRVVWLGIFTMVSITLLMTLCLHFVPSRYDHAQGALTTLFGFFPRLVVASLCAFWASQTYDVFAYQFWRHRFPAYRFIWLRNSMSTLVSQLMDNAIFTLIAFYGMFPLTYIGKLFITTCFLRTIIMLIDTPFIYWSVAIKKRVKEI